MLLRKMAFTKM
ncbi:hypothetical protein VCHC81A2_3003, partial [Vibrio cholerae HC-81A2]